MSNTEREILLTHEVKAKLRYNSNSSFYTFLKDKKKGFPMPFKVGGRNGWFKDEVEEWIEKQSENRGIDTYDEERKAKMRS